MIITCTRLYADEHGESHFEDVEIDLTLTEYAPPAPPLGLSSFTPATQFGFMNAPAGWSSDWHPATARSIFFVLSGEWEVTASDGEARRFASGSVLPALAALGETSGASERGPLEVIDMPGMKICLAKRPATGSVLAI